MSDTALQTRSPPEIVVFKHQLDARKGEFEAALPAHMPAERFMRVVMTAVQQNTDLMTKCDRRSLFTASMKCAQDGLLPDGREAALIPFKGVVQYLPMIAGIRKKARNSGEIATWDAQIVCENDDFEFELGDEPFIKHRPSLGDRGKPIAAYSIAVLKTGEKSREVMSIGEINAIRSRSRAGNSGPWVTDFNEMARKTVARRHSKVLPMSTDLDDLVRRDDGLYDMEGAKAAALESQAGKPRALGARLDMLARAPGDEVQDPETGEITTAGAAAAEDYACDAVAPQEAPDPDASTTPTDRAHALGAAAKAAGALRKAVPPEYREKGREDECAAWWAGWDGAPDMAGD